MEFNYLTVEEFKNSPFYCALPECCLSSGEIIDDMIEALSLEAQALIDSYLGYSLCNKQYKHIFTGDDSYSFFTDNFPINLDNEYSMFYRKPNRFNYYRHLQPNSTTTSGEITNFYIENENIGLVRIEEPLFSNYTYTFYYYAGYTELTLPKEIKTATKMLILNIAQRIDNMNLSNPDLSVDSIKVDKTATSVFGTSKTNKQFIAKSMLDFNDLPLPVLKILHRYKRII